MRILPAIRTIFGAREFVNEATIAWWISVPVAFAIFKFSLFLATTVYASMAMGAAPATIVFEDPELMTALISRAGMVWFVLMALLLSLFSGFVGSRWQTELGIVRTKGHAWWLVAVGVALAADFLVGMSISLWFPSQSEEDARHVIEALNNPAAFRYELFNVVIGAPVAEELLFRGFLLHSLARTRIGFWGASAATTAAWAYIHGYSWPGTASLLLSGILLSYVLWRTGSILPCVAYHSLSNTISVILAFAPTEVTLMP